MSAASLLTHYWRRLTRRPLVEPGGGALGIRTHAKWNEPPPLPVDTPDGPVVRMPPEGHPLAGLRVFLHDQVLRVSVPPQLRLGALFAFREGASATPWDLDGETKSASLIPRLTPWRRFVSAGELLVKAKQFDDGLYATVEVASQEACGSFRGKRTLLRALLEQMPGEGHAATHVAAACQVGGFHSTRNAAARQVAREFLADELRSKPIGFYTWSNELAGIFRQDRLLQSDLSEADDAGRLVGALAATPALRAGYDQWLRLAERCTHALTCADFRPWLTAIDHGVAPPPIDRTHPFPPWLALFPPSRSHETDLVKRLYGDRPIPEGFDLFGELTRAIRAGAIELAPRPDSGWYDWQTWALETLIAPERAEEVRRLEFTTSYRDHLQRLFRAALALARETHVKQLEVPSEGAALGPPVVVRPELRLEPLVTHYERRAAGYRFIRTVLVEAFGEAALDGLHRLRPDGHAEPTLAGELDFMTALFDGAANVARLELGASPAGDTSTFVGWMTTRNQDPDITGDLRMMVPVYYDVERRLTKVWMFLGWLEDTLDVSFAHPPEVRNSLGLPAAAAFEDASYPIATPVVIESLVSRVLDRDEFRALCDRCSTPDEIARALR